MEIYQFIFSIIIFILVFDFVLERILDIVNNRHRVEVLPVELNDIYDEEEYQKQQHYEKESTKFALLTSSISFIVIMLMLFLKGFAFVDGLAKSLTGNHILQSLLFFGILYFVSDIINIPFSVYDTFVIEEKYGFNKTSIKTFVLDKIKGWLLSIILGGLILGLIIWFYTIAGTNFWIYAWILTAVFMIFMNMFYSTLIVPLFNKQKPLESGALRDEIEKFSNNVGFKLDNIFVIDGSKRSTKANAYFSGLGPKKRIVLYDTLLNDLDDEEIVAVLAHEIGHYKLKHTLAGLVLSLIQTGIMLYILSLFINNISFSQALGVNELAFHLGLIVFGILYSPISLIIGLFMNVISRKNEFAADNFAKSNFTSEPLITALKKLTAKNLGNLTPHPIYVFFHYSHPTLLQRIRAMS